MLTTEILQIPSRLSLGRTMMLCTKNCHDSIGIDGIAPSYRAKTFSYKLCPVTLNLFFVSGFLSQCGFLTLPCVLV